MGRSVCRHESGKCRSFLTYCLHLPRFSFCININIICYCLGKDKHLWEEEVFKFARLQQLRAVSRYLPRGDNSLDPHIYEMVLYEYLKMDPQVNTIFIPRGKEGTRVRITQNKGKESENSYQKL